MGRVLYSRSFNCVIQGKNPGHILVSEVGLFSLGLFPCTLLRSNTLILRISMAEKSFDYKSWSLEELRAKARKRFILFTQKDGVKT